jgi:hypothetical protein
VYLDYGSDGNTRLQPLLDFTHLTESAPGQGSTFSFTLPAADGYSNNPGHLDEEAG